MASPFIQIRDNLGNPNYNVAAQSLSNIGDILKRRSSEEDAANRLAQQKTYQEGVLGHYAAQDKRAQDEADLKRKALEMSTIRGKAGTPGEKVSVQAAPAVPGRTQGDIDKSLTDLAAKMEVQAKEIDKGTTTQGAVADRKKLDAMKNEFAEKEKRYNEEVAKAKKRGHESTQWSRNMHTDLYGDKGVLWDTKGLKDIIKEQEDVVTNRQAKLSMSNKAAEQKEKDKQYEALGNQYAAEADRITATLGQGAKDATYKTATKGGTKGTSRLEEMYKQVEQTQPGSIERAALGSAISKEQERLALAQKGLKAPTYKTYYDVKTGSAKKVANNQQIPPRHVEASVYNAMLGKKKKGGAKAASISKSYDSIVKGITGDEYGDTDASKAIDTVRFAQAMGIDPSLTLDALKKNQLTSLIDDTFTIGELSENLPPIYTPQGKQISVEEAWQHMQRSGSKLSLDPKTGKMVMVDLNQN